MPSERDKAKWWQFSTRYLFLLVTGIACCLVVVRYTGFALAVFTPAVVGVILFLRVVRTLRTSLVLIGATVFALGVLAGILHSCFWAISA